MNLIFSNDLDPKSFLEVTGNLLLSDDPHELAVGLIAATGRKPHEILARATFTAIPEESYHVQFSAQGKKRGDSPLFKIATLYPAEYIIKCLTRLRREPTTRAIVLEVAQEFPHDREAQNRSIENRRGNSLRHVVQKFFGSKDDPNPVLSIRHGQEQDDAKSLRAAYGAIATERDCTKSLGSQMLYYVRLLGHFVGENPTDKDLQAVATSIGYADYYVTKSVPFPTASQKEKLSQVQVSKDDSELIKQLQKDWELPNQQAVINCLIKSHQNKVDVARELLEAKAHIAQLERLCNQLQQQNNQLTTKKIETTVNQPQQITINTTELEAFIERILFEKLKLALANLPIHSQTQPQTEQAISAWLDGRTFNGTVGLAPSTEGGFTGTRWKVHDVGNGIITLECLGHISGSKWLDGRTSDGTVGLAPSTEDGFTGTRWKVHDVGNEIITLECLGFSQPNQDEEYSQLSPEEMFKRLTKNAKLRWSQSSGDLRYIDHHIVDATNSLDIKLHNFILEAKFYNPYNGTDSKWKYGFSFRETSSDLNNPQRQVYTMWISSDDQILSLEGYENRLEEKISNLDVLENSFNQVHLLVFRETAIVYINNIYTQKFEIFDGMTPGKVYLVSAGNGSKSAKYESLKVRSISN